MIAWQSNQERLMYASELFKRRDPSQEPRLELKPSISIVKPELETNRAKQIHAMSIQLFFKMLRYGGGSLLAVASDVGLMLLLVNYAGMSYLSAAATGFVVGCVVKYLVSTYFVYEDNRGDDKALSIVLFVAIAVCGLLANHVIIYLGVEVFGLHLLFAKIISAGFVFVMNFFLLGVIVFKDPLLVETENKSQSD